MQTNDPIPSTPQALAAGTRAPTRPPCAPGASTSPAGSLDAALERLQAGYPSTDVHRSNHVPMVVEALEAWEPEYQRMYQHPRMQPVLNVGAISSGRPSSGACSGRSRSVGS